MTNAYTLRKDEHSFRSLLYQCGQEQLRELSAAALIESASATRPAEGDALEALLHRTIVGMNLKRALDWLAKLPTELCPEVRDLADELADKVAAGATTAKVMSDVLGELKQTIEAQAQHRAQRNTTN